VRPVSDEVDSVEWVPWESFRAAVLSGERDVSPWCVSQVRELPTDLAGARAVDADALPAAAR
jgi:isopentenyl-diphosphate delta-isomerase